MSSYLYEDDVVYDDGIEGISFLGSPSSKSLSSSRNKYNNIVNATKTNSNNNGKDGDEGRDFAVNFDYHVDAHYGSLVVNNKLYYDDDDNAMNLRIGGANDAAADNSNGEGIRNLLDFDHLKWIGRSLGIIYALWIVMKVGRKKWNNSNSTNLSIASTNHSNGSSSTQSTNRSSSGTNNTAASSSSNEERRQQTQQEGQTSSSDDVEMGNNISESAAVDATVDNSISISASSSSSFEAFARRIAHALPVIYYLYANVILFIMIFCFDDDEFPAIVMTISSVCEFLSIFWYYVLNERDQLRKRNFGNKKRKQQPKQQQRQSRSSSQDETVVNETTNLINTGNNRVSSFSLYPSSSVSSSAFRKEQKLRIMKTICCMTSAYFLWIVVLGPLEVPDIT